MELLIPLHLQSEIPLYEQIYRHIKQEIRSGNLKKKRKLPSTRVLAEHLSISRSTTQLAYDQLMSEGYIEAIPYKGYYVTPIEELIEVRQDLEVKRVSAHTGLKAAAYQVDFSPRGIDLDRFPFHVWRKLSRNTLVDDHKGMFASGNPQGEIELRCAIGDYLHSARGVNCVPEQILIGAGSEYLLMLLSLILGSGRVIAMENLTYKQAYRVFSSLALPIKPIDMDRFGMSVEQLEESGADTGYVMPSRHYPLGIVMPVQRRQQLLSWAAKKSDRYLIEDDYDSEFRYKGKPIPALQGMDTRGCVIYMGTFSKSIAPAIRISYLVLPPLLLARYQNGLGFYASTVSRIDQNILYHFLVEGHYERHLNRMRKIYKMKHDVMMAALKPLEREFTISGDYAGLHLLLTNKSGRTEGELIEKAEKAGVKIYALSGFFLDVSRNYYPSTVILGYASLTDEEIKEGIQLLIDTWM